MSKLDIKLVEKMYSDYGQELTSDKLEYITSQFSNNNDFSNSFLKKYDPEKSVSNTEVEKKNLDSTSTSGEVQSESPTQEPKKKSLSVGGKPVQAGASASSAGKGKGKKAERSSEELLSEFGFKNKEEQKKAGAVASKVKVDATIPVAVKTTKQKEEAYKTDKQKAVEQEGSLITEKYKREEEKKFVEDFRNATAIPDDYEAQVREEVQSELEGTGLWNTVSQGAANIWNKIVPYIPGAPSSKDQIEQLKSDITFLPKAMDEYKSILLKQGVKEDEITNEDLTKGAIDLEINKRVEDKKLSLANDYLDNLPNDVKNRMKIGAFNQMNIKSPEANKKFDLIKAIDEDIKADNEELVRLEALAKENNGLSPEDADRYGSLTASLKAKVENRKNQYNIFKSTISELTTAEEEYDLFKRSYGFEDKAGKLLNAVSDFGLGALQFVNMLSPGANQDNIALELAGIKSEKDKLVADKLQKQVDSAKNLNDILDYGSDVLISQSSNIALGYLTGGTGMMLGIGTSAAGNRYSELIKLNSEGYTDYSKFQMYLSSGIYGASEMIESNTMRMIGGAKNIIGKALKNEPSRKLFAEGLATKTYKTGKEFLRNYKGELKEELTTFGAQKISDIVVLDIDSKEVFKNAKQEIKSLVKDTGVMVVGLNLFPATFAKVTKAFAPKDYTYNLDKNNKIIDELSAILSNKDASDVTKLEAKNKIDQIVKSNEEGLIKIIKNTANIEDKLIDKVIEIESSNSNLRNKAEQIRQDKTISKSQKDILISGIKEEFDKNEILREDIILGRKTSFDILSDEDQAKVKQDAANLLKQEEINKGVLEEDINIPAETINKKAKELYNQKLKEENEKITRETNAEESASRGSENQAIYSEKQKDGSIKLQEEEIVEPTIKDSQIPLKRETFEYEDGNGDTKIVEVTTNKDGSRTFISKDQDGNTAGFTRVGKDNTLATDEYVNSAYGDIKGEPKVEQGNDIMNPAMKAKLTPQQKAELGIKEEVITPKTQEQAVSATQQKSNVELQEEVDKLRVQELNELTENVENPENFITDGKVDAKKVSESDNAKAKEIYAKYDKLLKPLLNNIKTQRDAVQEQSTNEGVLQPEQSKMGLQEVEQGDQVGKKPTEQSKEKVNTKISDPYTSAEVDRVKTLPAESEDGATMNLDGSKYEGGGLVIPLASKNMDASELTPQAIQDFVDENAESVGADNVKVGIYKFPNSNQVSIDINIVADPSNREEALAIGKELGQESLFDLDTFENVKTGADGMNPKKLTPSEFRDIQERLKPKSKGVEVSKDVNEAKKQVANIVNKKIARSILNGVKAISKILPNVKIILHYTDDSFRSVSGESKNQESSGLYENGNIHINLSKANGRTVPHEIFHAILLDVVKTDFNAQIVTKKMIEAIAAKIDNNPKLKAKLEEFASMYDENIQNEEKLAELMGIMAENYNSLSARAKEIIKNWLNNLAKSFGVELFKDNEVFDVLNTIAKKVATGSEIGVEDISILDNGTNPIGGPTEIIMPKKRESKIDFKDSYENSLVTPDKKVDIYSLLKDIVAKKQKIWFWVADQLGVNDDLDGGPSFAHQKDGDIWASSMNTKSIENNINKSDYIFIISGSPTVSKLFNKKVFDKMTSNLGSFNDFKKEALKRKPTKDIVEILNNFKSWDDLRSSTSRKPFLIAINESSKKPNTEFHKYIESLNGYFDLNDFRDGFYRDNNFEQNDIMLVLKPTGVRSGSEHSTYENTVEGEVIGVPDVKINALEVMPKEMADKYSGKNAQASQAIAPYGSGVKEISTIPSKRQQKQNKQELSDAKKEIQDVFSAAKEALKIEKDKNKVINDLKNKVNAFVKVAIQNLKAGDIGKRAITSIASKVQSVTDQNFDEKLLEVNDVLDNLYTNRDVNKAKADKKKALKNVMAGKVGKLDKKGDRAKVMASKIVNFALLDPAILKKVLDDANFGLYTSYISNLAERKDALSDTDLKSYDKLYDEIVAPYKEYTDKVNQIQGKIDNNQDLSESEKAFVEKNKSDFYEKEDVEAEEEKDAEKKAKKEAEIAKKKAAIKALLPMMPQVFEDSDAEKGSFEWKILSALTTLDESDIDAMPEAMLSNVTNVLNSMINDDVIPTYAEDLYRYAVKNKAKNLFLDTVAKAGKGGLYKTKAGRAVLKVREVLGNPITTIRGIINGDVNAELLEKRIKMFRFSAIDAALKIYGETPIFDGIASVLGKGMSNLANTEAKAEEALLNAKKLIDKKSKNPQESYMKITYFLIDAMAKNNQGTKSDVSAMEYFEATISDPNAKIRENKAALKAVQDFVAKVKANGGLIELTPEEATAANAIRIVLDENQVSAYEANLFQNANAAPMITEYFPVSNSVKAQTDSDLANMQSRFGIGGTVSTKSGNLEEKTGKAHPIDMNPFTAAFSSIKNTAVQFNLRSEYLGISRGLQESINEAVKNGDRDSELFLNGIKKALDSEFDLIINGSVFGSNDLMDNVFNAIDKTFYQVMLGSVISRSVDYTGNIIQLAALNPKLLVSGNKIIKDLKGELKSGESEVELLRAFYKNAEASDINKMISSKNSSTERTEFLNKGVNKNVLSKGLPFSNTFTRIKAKFVNPVDEKLSGINESLISISDVKPYGISWNSIFRDAFLAETGNDVDVAKVARGDKKYLKDNADAIKRASNKANRESADLFGSTNPFEKQVGIMEVTAGKKNSRNPLSALINRAKYFLSGFNIGANTSMTTAINTFSETKDPREARKALGGAIRVGMYRTAVSAVSSMIWSLFKGDDDDEDKLVESFDKLAEDDKFIKEMNNLFLDFPIRKDRDGNSINLSMNDFEQYNKLRDKLLSNKDFKNAYDIYYKFINRNLFDEAVRLRANQINNSKDKVFKENIVMFFDEIKRGFPKDDTQIIETLAVLHSNEGAKLFTSNEVDEYILDLENHMSKIGFLDNRALRDANSQIDRMIINETALLLSDHRNESAGDIVVKEGAQLLMGLMFPRSNNIVKGSYNYLAESANKMMTQSRRGERGYDIYKDMIFQPIVKTGLSDKKGNQEVVKEAIGVLNPALKDLLKKDNADAATVSMLRYIKTIGTIGLNDFNKINSKMKNDEIYQKTNGKFKKNIINEIAKDKVDIIRSVTDKEGVESDAKEKGTYKSRVLPGIDSTEVKSNLPSYMNKKDLKINGRSVE